MSKSGIYRITNTRTGESYIGQSVNMENRLNQHKNELNKGTHHNYGLQRDYNRGDKFDFEVLEYTPYLDEREKYYIGLYDTHRNGYNMTRGGSGVRYSPTYYQEDKTVENFFIACGVFLGLFLLILYISSFIFRPLGNYNDMIISTIVALFGSTYVILRWKKGFKLGISEYFANRHEHETINNKTNPNNKVISDYINDSKQNTKPNYKKRPYVFVNTNVECRSRINNMKSDYFEKLVSYFQTPRYQLRSDQIIFLFRNYSEEEIIEKVNELIVDEIYDNLSISRRKEPEDVLRQNISQICELDIKTFNSLCDDFSVPKYYKKEGQVQYLLNNYSFNEIIENDRRDKVETKVEDENLQKVNYMP